MRPSAPMPAVRAHAEVLDGRTRFGETTLGVAGHLHPDILRAPPHGRCHHSRQLAPVAEDSGLG